MGYRSEVFIAINKKAYEEEIMLGKGKNEEFHNSARYLSEYDAYFWYISSIKWYARYELTTYVEGLLSAIEESEHVYHENKNYVSLYTFVRIGEDYGDVEVQGDCFAFGLSPTTSVDMDFATLDKPTIGEINAAA